MAEEPDDSILNTTKKLLNAPADYTAFDLDVMTFINSTFAVLSQMGVGPKTAFTIHDATTQWSEFIGDNPDLGMVRSYMYAKVRMMFDPPPNSFTQESVKEVIREYEYRLNVAAETP